MNRNLDPDNYLFDISADLKSISSDENNRVNRIPFFNLLILVLFQTHEENGSHEANYSETSTMEVRFFINITSINRIEFLRHLFNERDPGLKTLELNGLY